MHNAAKSTAIGLGEVLIARSPPQRDDADTLDLLDLIERVSIHSLDDVRPCAVNFAEIANRLGLRIALCADIASSRPIVDAEGRSLNAEVFGWVNHRERWWADARFALHSPIPRACRYESEPFWCDRDGFHTFPPNPFLEDIDLSTNFTKFKAMIVVPVHLPFGQISANSCPLIEGGSAEAARIFEKHGYALGALTRRFISSYIAVTSRPRSIPHDCGLSRREVECVKWASIGKTDDEIAEIMTVCRSTVRYHVKRAGEKLGSVNRTQTVFKAGQLGYLSTGKISLTPPIA